MKNKVTILLIIAIICVSLAFGACKYFSPLIDYYGVVLAVDDSGHFKEDIVYTRGSTTWKFAADGTYERYSESFEDEGESHDGDVNLGEGWVKTSGDKGTYTWSDETFERVLVLTQFISSGEWVDRTNTRTETMTMYFTDQSFNNVYMGGMDFTFDTVSGTGSGYTSITETADTSKNTEIFVLEINEDEGIFSLFERNESRDSTGSITGESEDLYQGTYSTNPVKANIDKAGEPFTVDLLITKSYADDIGTLDEDRFNESISFIAGGKTSLFGGTPFWIEWPADPARRALTQP